MEMPGKEMVGVEKKKERKKGGKLQTAILPVTLMLVFALWMFC